MSISQFCKNLLEYMGKRLLLSQLLSYILLRDIARALLRSKLNSTLIQAVFPLPNVSIRKFLGLCMGIHIPMGKSRISVPLIVYGNVLNYFNFITSIIGVVVLL